MMNQWCIPETLMFSGWEEVAIAFVPFNATISAIKLMADKDEDFRRRLMIALYESHPYKASKL